MEQGIPWHNTYVPCYFELDQRDWAQYWTIEKGNSTRSGLDGYYPIRSYVLSGALLVQMQNGLRIRTHTLLRIQCCVLNNESSGPWLPRVLHVTPYAALEVDLRT